MINPLRSRSVAAVVATASLLLAAVACSSGDGSADGGNDSPESAGAEGAQSTEAPTTAAPTTTAPPPELPGGGRSIFPEHRVVAYYGNSQSAAMGVLGETGPEEAVGRLAEASAPFADPDRPVLGAFELIVSVAQPSPGADGDYSVPTPPEQIQQWLDVARANDLLLLLDVQPGRASFVDAVKPYESFLRQPDVGLALDPEWRMGPGEVPGQTIGSVDVTEVNEVSAWLSDIVEAENLPEKLFVVHQFVHDMITRRPALADREGLATVVHIDGFGTQDQKIEKYEALAAIPPFENGLKLFYDEDIDMFTPDEALALEPSPDLITYQ